MPTWLLLNSQYPKNSVSKEGKKTGEEGLQREVQSCVAGCEREGEWIKILCSKCHGDLKC